MEQFESLKKKLNRIQNDADGKSIDYEKYKALQQHSTQQQQLLQQLRNRLEVHE